MAETDVLAHSYFGASILPDIFNLISNDLAPDARFGLLPATTEEDGRYWELQPGAL